MSTSSIPMTTFNMRMSADLKKNFLNFPKNLHSNTGTGDYFPKKVISS